MKNCFCRLSSIFSSQNGKKMCAQKLFPIHVFVFVYFAIVFASTIRILQSEQSTNILARPTTLRFISILLAVRLCASLILHVFLYTFLTTNHSARAKSERLAFIVPSSKLRSRKNKREKGKRIHKRRHLVWRLFIITFSSTTNI